MRCPDPQFIFDEEYQRWSPCLACGQIAWDHEQSSPFTDMANTMERDLYGGHPRDYPPEMRENE